MFNFYQIIFPQHGLSVMRHSVSSVPTLMILFGYILFMKFGTRKAEVLNSLIINTTAKANDTTDILQTFR